MIELLSEMTRADWLTRRWVDTTPPGSTEMMSTDAGDFPQEQRGALLQVLNSRSAESARVARRAARNDERVAR
jgi:hypothetical protein